MFLAYVLASAGFREEGIESIIAAADALVRGHLPIGLNAMLKAEQLPANTREEEKKAITISGGSADEKASQYTVTDSVLQVAHGR